MWSYCLQCKKILRVLIQTFLQLVMVEQLVMIVMILSKYAICGSKKSKFIKKSKRFIK